MGLFFDNRADIICEIIVRENGLWILASARVPILLKTRCEAGDKCLYPHYKVMDNQIKRRKRATSQKERDDKNAVTIVKTVSHLGCVSQDSDALVSQGTDAESLGTNSKGTIHQVHATPCEYPGKERTIMSKFLISEVPYAMKFEDSSHQETERQQRCARSKAWKIAKHIYKLKEKDKAAFYFLPEEWVLPAASTKEPEVREFVFDSGASMHMVSNKDLDSDELETMRT